MKDLLIKNNNNVNIPPIGFGTGLTFIFGRHPVKAGKKYVKDILYNRGKQFKKDICLYKVAKGAPKAGCFLFDTARAYKASEKILGCALKKYDRNKIFVITKLSNRDQREGDIKKAVKYSLEKLQMDYIDLYLMHWPQTDTYLESWIKMEQIYKEGLARAIGVCNFHIHHFEDLMKVATIKPAVHEFECHPLYNQAEMVEYCRKSNIKMIAYTPTCRMDKRLRENEFLQNLTKKYKKNITQIILRWHYQREIIPIFNTSKIQHLKENMNIFDFNLELFEIESINKLDVGYKYFPDSDKCDFMKL